VKRWECLAPSEVEQVYKPNSVSRCFRVGMATIHLVQPLPVGSSDLPGGRISLLKPQIWDLINCFGRAALLTPPYLILHREEFAWPRLSPNAPVRSYFKPVGAAPFHPLSRLVGTGLLSVALVVIPSISDYKSQNYSAEDRAPQVIRHLDPKVCCRFEIW